MSSRAEPAGLPTPILVVDNDPANLRALHALLDDLGHHLVDAHSGEEALRRLQERDFALVLLDVHIVSAVADVAMTQGGLAGDVQANPIARGGAGRSAVVADTANGIVIDGGEGDRLGDGA